MSSELKKVGIVFFIVAIFIAGCVAPGALKAEVTGLKARFDKLEKVAEEITIWKKTVQAETINYGGAGWVVIGSIFIVTIFLGAFVLMIRMLLKKTNLLKLVTCAVQKTDSHIRKAIKDQISEEVSNGGPFKAHHKQQLRQFTEKVGTFAEKD